MVKLTRSKYWLKSSFIYFLSGGPGSVGDYNQGRGAEYQGRQGDPYQGEFIDRLIYLEM